MLPSRSDQSHIVSKQDKEVIPFRHCFPAKEIPQPADVVAPACRLNVQPRFATKGIPYDVTQAQPPMGRVKELVIYVDGDVNSEQSTVSWGRGGHHRVQKAL